ncbi:MAG: alpha/beta fold hydrolase [Bacteroidales bacterium]|jgi:dienelactone hydrolase|nr:alpha/beta fold hydrolase [Bacteroidales bacterium]
MNRNKIKKLALCIILQIGLIQLYAGKDPFAEYQNSIPAIKQVISEEMITEGSSEIVIRKFIFDSRNHTNEVYSIMAVPSGDGVYPAILFLHGGGSRAEDMYHLVREYAGRGYVTMAIDLPGLCGIDKTPYSRGPWKIKEKEKGMEEARIDVSEQVRGSTLVDAEVAGIEAINYLRTMPEVNISRIGITGFSWGGYSTTILAGLLGNKIKAAYSVYGCGYYEKGSFWIKWLDALSEKDRKTWLKYLDAGRRAKNMRAAYFIEAASNDTFFWPPAVEATLNAIRGSKNLVWRANLNHRQLAQGKLMQQLYLDYHLKGIGSPFAQVSVSKNEKQKNGNQKVTIQVNAPESIKINSVKLYYSGMPASGKWQEREWIEIKAQPVSGNIYHVTIPEKAVKSQADYFVSAEDDRTVITSSKMYTIKK